jgi:hypothetical protein
VFEKDLRDFTVNLNLFHRAEVDDDGLVKPISRYFHFTTIPGDTAIESKFRRLRLPRSRDLDIRSTLRVESSNPMLLSSSKGQSKLRQPLAVGNGRPIGAQVQLGLQIERQQLWPLRLDNR